MFLGFELLRDLPVEPKRRKNKGSLLSPSRMTGVINQFFTTVDEIDQDLSTKKKIPFETSGQSENCGHLCVPICLSMRRAVVEEEDPESRLSAEVRMRSPEYRAKMVAVEKAKARLAFAVQGYKKSRARVVAATAELKVVTETRGKETGATTTTTNASAGGREETVTEANER